MLSNAYLLAKFRFDTAENERNFAKNLPKTDYYPTYPRGHALQAHEVHVPEQQRFVESLHLAFGGTPRWLRFPGGGIWRLLLWLRHIHNRVLLFSNISLRRFPDVR